MGSQVVGSGGTAISTTVNAGSSCDVGEQDVYGLAVSTTVNGGAQEIVLSAGTASVITILSGGSETISAGGTDFGAEISGGEQDVYGNASATVDSGGYQYVGSGGTASDAVIYAAGDQEVDVGATAIGATLSGGEQDVYGSASGTTVDSGGYQYVGSSGTASDAVIYAAGNQDVDGFATAIGATLSGGEQDVY
jgi:autotransporter passenger strand-loop-strand repeat protein